jgi:hypothetical protein
MLLDNASEINLVSNSMAERLNLKPNKFFVPINDINDLPSAEVKYTFCVDTHSKFNGFCIKLNL